MRKGNNIAQTGNIQKVIKPIIQQEDKSFLGIKIDALILLVGIELLFQIAENIRLSITYKEITRTNNHPYVPTVLRGSIIVSTSTHISHMFRLFPLRVKSYTLCLYKDMHYLTASVHSSLISNLKSNSNTLFICHTKLI